MMHFDFELVLNPNFIETLSFDKFNNGATQGQNLHIDLTQIDTDVHRYVDTLL